MAGACGVRIKSLNPIVLLKLKATRMIMRFHMWRWNAGGKLSALSIITMRGCCFICRTFTRVYPVHKFYTCRGVSADLTICADCVTPYVKRKPVNRKFLQEYPKLIAAEYIKVRDALIREVMCEATISDTLFDRFISCSYCKSRREPYYDISYGGSGNYACTSCVNHVREGISDMCNKYLLTVAATHVIVPNVDICTLLIHVIKVVAVDPYLNREV